MVNEGTAVGSGVMGARLLGNLNTSGQIAHPGHFVAPEEAQPVSLTQHEVRVVEETVAAQEAKWKQIFEQIGEARQLADYQVQHQKSGLSRVREVTLRAQQGPTNKKTGPTYEKTKQIVI